MVLLKKLLIVDDDPDILEALLLTFDSAAYDVRTITHAEKTYQEVKEFKPNVIILDVLLSGIDGRHVCKKLKEDQNTKHIPIIMLSAHPDAITSTIRSGADDFVSKPFDIDVLIKKVEKLTS